VKGGLVEQRPSYHCFTCYTVSSGGFGWLWTLPSRCVFSCTACRHCMSVESDSSVCVY